MAAVEVSGSCALNVGGIAELKLIDIEDILTMPRVNADLVVTSGITLKPDGTYILIRHVDEGADASEVHDASENGSAYKVAISCSMGTSKDSAILRWCRDNDRRRFVALVKDANGVTRLFGTPQQPLTLSHENSTGRFGSDRHDHVLRLQGRCRRPAPLYEPPTLLLATTSGYSYFLITDLSSALAA